MEEKTKKLEELKKKMENDRSLPLREGNPQLVFGEGNPGARVLFIGEGPGFHEDRLGRPFVGAAGKLLDRLLESINTPRESVFITNVVHFRPPSNRDPLPQEIAAFQPYLDEIIEIISPEVIVTLGRYSMAKFLPGARISSVHGRPSAVKWPLARLVGRDIVVMPMYHPAAALRNGQIMNQLKEDFKKITEALDSVEKGKQERKNKVTQNQLF